MDTYIGLDAHVSSCTLGVLGPSGKRLELNGPPAAEKERAATVSGASAATRSRRSIALGSRVVTTYGRKTHSAEAAGESISGPSLSSTHASFQDESTSAHARTPSKINPVASSYSCYGCSVRGSMGTRSVLTIVTISRR